MSFRGQRNRGRHLGSQAAPRRRVSRRVGGVDARATYRLEQRMISIFVLPSSNRRSTYAGAGLEAHAAQHDAPQRIIRLTVAAGVESTAGDLARRRRDGGDAAQVRPRCFAARRSG